jgi:sulfonate transport system ATP-binding protein
MTQAACGLSITLKGVQKQFGARIVLRDLDLAIPAGQFVAVVGRSGCGKSTLLRLLAGLETATAGALQAGRSQGLSVVAPAGDLRDRSFSPIELEQGLQAVREDIRLMFQDSRLLPWKSVIDNVGLGLKGNWRPQAYEALEAVGLRDRAHEWPAALSGGQRQRVALARALIHRPRLLLLDEPLGALDALTRIEMQQLIEKLWRQHGFTVLLVTHDVSEAVSVADRVILIEEGRIGLDLLVEAAHPRVRGSARLAALEAQVLNRVLNQPQSAANTDPFPAPRPFKPLRAVKTMGERVKRRAVVGDSI